MLPVAMEPTVVAVLAWYGGLSLVAYVMYATDKRAARRHKSGRVPEAQLHIVSLFGGWPGALLAQRLLHHKHKKREFMSSFWLSVFVNVVFLAALYFLSKGDIWGEILGRTS